MLPRTEKNGVSNFDGLTIHISFGIIKNYADRVFLSAILMYKPFHLTTNMSFFEHFQRWLLTWVPHIWNVGLEIEITKFVFIAEP